MVRDQDVRPGLAVVRVGEDPASAVYVRGKIRACEEVGIRSEHHALPESTTTAELLTLIGSLNSRHDIDGILTQLPLPREVDENATIEAMIRQKTSTAFTRLAPGSWRWADRFLCLALPPASSSCSMRAVLRYVERMRVSLVAARL